MANPDFLNVLGDEMGNVYAACSDRILVNLARHFERLDPDDLKPGGAFQYQAQKLAEFGQVTAETVEIIRDMMEGADQALKDCLEAAIIDALEDVEPQLKRAAQASLLNGGRVPPVVQPQLTQTFRAYYAQSADRLNLVNTSMLESTGNAYRRTVADITNRMMRAQRILNESTGLAITGVESANSAIRIAVDQLVKNGITGFVDHAGNNWRPETYVAMDMRSTFHNTARAAFWERNEDYTNDLYLVSQHPGARPLCYPWQCKVISRRDLARRVDDGDGREVRVYAQSETSYGEPAGLFGINCGHHPLCFIPGVSRVPALLQDEDANAQTYAESQKQRGLERRLRQARLELDVARARKEEKDEIKKRREAVQAAADRLDEFCEETGRKRRREREYAPVNADWPNPDTYGKSPTAVRDALRDWFQGNGDLQGGALTGGGGSGTMKQEQGMSAIPEEIKGDYQDFKELTLGEKELQKLDELHQKALGSGFEHGSAVVNGELSPTFTSENANEVQVPEEYLDLSNVSLLHSHTNDTVLSGSDFAFLLRDNVANVAVKNRAGEVFNVAVGNGYRPDKDEFEQALGWARREAEYSIFSQAREKGWTGEQTFYMVIREQARLLAGRFEWDLEGGMP